MGDLDHVAARAGRRPGRRAASEFVDPDVAGPVDVIDVEAPAGRVVGREGDREQPALAFEGDELRDVEERPAEAPAVPHDLDPAALLDDEEQLRGAGGAGHVDRAFEVADPLQPDAVSGAFPGRRRFGGAGRPRGAGRAAGGERGEGQGGDCEAGTSAASHPGYLPDSAPFPISTTSPESVTSVFTGAPLTSDLERAAGCDAGGGLGLCGAAEAGVDAVEDGEPAGLDRAQLPDPFDGRARLQRAEVEGLAARGGRASAFGRRRRGLWIAFGEDPDRPVGLRQIRLRVADPEGKRRRLAFLAARPRP